MTPKPSAEPAPGADPLHEWWHQYEDTARSLKLMGDAYPAGSPERRLLYTADDDMRTLVDGLRQLERERGAGS